MQGSSRRLAVALAIGLAGAAITVSEPGFRLEEELGLAWLFQLRGAREPPPEAVIVRTESALISHFRALPDRVEEWPAGLAACHARYPGLDRLPVARDLDRLPRAVYACLIDELGALGAEAIVFDIAFRQDPARVEGTRALASAVARHGGVVLLARAVRTWLLPGETAEGRARRADVLEMPDPLLQRAALAVAPFVLPRSGTRVHQFWVYNDALSEPVQLPMRAIEARAVRAAEAGGPEAAHFAAALERARAGPAYRYLGFYGPPGAIPSIPLYDVVTGAFRARAGERPLAGKTVFVGYQELARPQAEDSYPTVFRNALGVDLSGVEIGATAYVNLLHDQALSSLPEIFRALLVAALGAALALIALSGSVWRGLAGALILGAAYFAGAFGAFVVADFWLPVALPLLVLVPVAVLAGQLDHYLGAARWLHVYVPRGVSDKLLRGREELVGAVERREVSVMLTDIIGYSTFAERVDPKDVTAFVNHHFTLLTRLVEAESGIVSQFIGDAMMAFWGAPDPALDHAARACRTALAIAAALETDNRLRQQRGEAPVRIRIGINTGFVTAGNVGAPGRSYYNIVGDTVNVTQRIEQLGKGVDDGRSAAVILVSRRTADHAGPGFRFESMGTYDLRGRRSREEVLRLLGTAPAMPTAAVSAR